MEAGEWSDFDIRTLFGQAHSANVEIKGSLAKY